jgi:hypothetical protein
VGEILMTQKKPAEALREFQTSLAAQPGRAHSLFGAMRAARAAGDTKAEREASAIWIHNHAKQGRPFGYTPLDAGSDR